MNANERYLLAVIRIRAKATGEQLHIALFTKHGHNLAEVSLAFDIGQFTQSGLLLGIAQRFGIAVFHTGYLESHQ